MVSHFQFVHVKAECIGSCVLPEAHHGKVSLLLKETSCRLRRRCGHQCRPAYPCDAAA